MEQLDVTMACSERSARVAGLIAIVPLAMNWLVVCPWQGLCSHRATIWTTGLWLHPDGLSAHPDRTTKNVIGASLSVLTSICSKCISFFTSSNSCKIVSISTKNWILPQQGNINAQGPKSRYSCCTILSFFCGWILFWVSSNWIIWTG